MSKAVMISIRPEWCELIVSGKKTIEVRKNRPKLTPPFKCYIYCTKPKGKYDWGLCRDNLGIGLFSGCNYEYAKGHEMAILSGMVIGEFVCDKILDIFVSCSDPNMKGYPFPGTGLTDREIMDYLGNGKTGFGWHISDLVIYDKLQELSAFRIPCKEWDKDSPRCGVCEYYYYESNESIGFYDECMCDGLKHITRPPQSWCYVEELGGDG